MALIFQHVCTVMSMCPSIRLKKICQVLNCKIDDIVEFLPEPNQSVHDNELKE